MNHEKTNPITAEGLRLLMPLVQAHYDPVFAMNQANKVQSHYRDALEALLPAFPQYPHVVYFPLQESDGGYKVVSQRSYDELLALVGRINKLTTPPA